MKDWDILFAEGKFASGAYVTVKYWKIDPEKHERRAYAVENLKIGFAVGKKVHKSAVQRNKIKRQIREVVRLLIKDSRIKQGYMVGIIAKPSIVGKKYEEIERDVYYSLRKAGLIAQQGQKIA